MNTSALPANPATPPLHRDAGRDARQALLVWAIFFVLLVIFNGTVPFMLGADLHAWTQSPVKSVIFGFLFYGLLFLATPLVLVKGWRTVRQPGFLLPLCIALAALSLWHFFPPVVALAVGVIAYLHRRFDLSELGLRSRGWKGDLLAVALMGVLGLFPLLMRAPSGLALGPAARALLTRLFANPASSVENLFYFGFLAERLAPRLGNWLTPLAVASLYTAHELSNPEYWYGNVLFGLVFGGIALWAAIYLWRRSAIVIWLGDGLYRFAGALF